jgi:predicted acetyltransferase
MELILRELEIGDELEARAAHLEFPDWQFLLTVGAVAKINEIAWSTHVEECRKMRLGIDLPKGRVPATFFIAEVDGELVGRASIRHELNTFLLNYGGHIGYGVRPQFRRRGYATEILRQSLEYIRGLGVDDVLVTCHDENVGSAVVIESCGGKLENIVEFEGKPLRRYWI